MYCKNVLQCHMQYLRKKHCNAYCSTKSVCNKYCNTCNNPGICVGLILDLRSVNLLVSRNVQHLVGTGAQLRSQLPITLSISLVYNKMNVTQRMVQAGLQQLKPGHCHCYRWRGAEMSTVSDGSSVPQYKHESFDRYTRSVYMLQSRCARVASGSRRI